MKLNYLIMLELHTGSRIEVDPTATVGDLLKRIYKEHNKLIGPLDQEPDCIPIHKVVDGKMLPVEGMRARIERCAERRLSAAESLGHVFPGGEPDWDNIHLALYPLKLRSGAKRPFKYVFEPNKRLRVSTISPSKLAKVSVYKDTQRQSSERILDDRPKRDEGIPPMALLYDGFGHFLDVFHGRIESPLLTSATFEGAVNEFASEMIQFHDLENLRRDIGLQKLNKIFTSGNGPKFVAGSVGSLTTDGHVLGNDYVACCVVEFKNEITGISGIPEIEMTSYVAHIRRAALESSRKERVEGKAVPCLGIIVVSPYITFFGVHLLGLFRLVALTPALSCVPSAGDGYDRRALCRAFAAAVELEHRLQELQKESEPSQQSTTNGLPYVSRLRTYPHSPSSPPSGEYLDFQIIDLYPDIQDYRLLYTAQTNAGDEILVKFTKRYGIELHDFCMKKGHAPTILAFDELPGGWYALAMEYVKSAVPLSSAPNLVENREHWKKELVDLVEEFHTAGLVHGDLRDPNILYDTDNSKVLLVDFDWGGKANEVSYDTALLNPELTNGRNRNDLLITPEDDDRVLKNTLDHVLGWS